jgi:hypothetical protein
MPIRSSTSFVSSTVLDGIHSFLFSWSIFLANSYANGSERWCIGLIKLRLCVPGSLYATHVAQPVAWLPAVGGVQGVKHAFLFRSSVTFYLYCVFDRVFIFHTR